MAPLWSGDPPILQHFCCSWERSGWVGGGGTGRLCTDWRHLCIMESTFYRNISADHLAGTLTSVFWCLLTTQHRALWTRNGHLNTFNSAGMLVAHWQLETHPAANFDRYSRQHKKLTYQETQSSKEYNIFSRPLDHRDALQGLKLLVM